MPITGQCATDPVSGVSGDIYTAWSTDPDAGLAAAALVSGGATRALLAAQIEATAASIVSAVGGIATDPTGTVTTTNATFTTIVTLSLAANAGYGGLVHVKAMRDGVLDATGVYYLDCARVGSGSPAVTGFSALYDTISTPAGWAVQATTSGNDVLLQVRGAIGETVRWSLRVSAASL